MIKAGELRVGNLVTIAHETNSPIVTVETITPNFINVFDNRTGYDIDFVLPIKLTPEWLERFGFVLDAFDAWNLELTTRFASKTLLVFASDYLYMRQFNTDKRHEDDICTIWNKDIMKHFYVHDLQNLYFALTGQELELKDIFADYTAEQRNEAAKLATDIIKQAALSNNVTEAVK